MVYVRLGLIGDNIAMSRAPELYRLFGKLSGLAVNYDLLVPRELNLELRKALQPIQTQRMTA